MPHLEEQFPPVNPLVLQRPDALDPPGREEEEEETRPVENRAEDEAPLPGSLADGIDRITLSANARVIAPVQPLEETVSSPLENAVNPAVPELLNLQAQRREVGAEAPAADEITGTDLQGFVDGLEENRASNPAATRADRNPAEQPAAPGPAIPLVQNAERRTGEEAVSRIENRITAVAPPAANVEPERDEVAAPVNENRFIPLVSPPRGPLPIEPDNAALAEPAAGTPLENPLGLRGDTPEPLDRRVNILTPANVGDDSPGPNIQETRNFGEGQTLSLDLETAGSESEVIFRNTVDEVLQDAGAIPGPGVPEPQVETVPSPPAAPPGVNVAPTTTEAEADPQENIVEPILPDSRGVNAQRDPPDIPGPTAPPVAVSSLTDTRQVFEEDQETQALQRPAFPELDPDEPFVPNVQPETREENIPAVVPAPVNDPLPALENPVPPVAPPAPGNVEALNENPAALRRSNLGTEPALRSNRELRNFLQEFNDRIEPPEEVTEPVGGPITEVQNNAPPPPALFENLETVRAELLNDLREPEEREGVTRPEEQPIAPPEPRTPESLLTERGQNIDRFI